MKSVDDIEQQLRYRIIGHLHAGRLTPGDRLPSIRESARQMGADHRRVAAAYRELEREGMVEIRPGSGVYAAINDQAGAVSLEQVRWLGQVFHEGWRRGLSRAETGETFSRTASTSIRCGMIESNLDHMVAFCTEVSESASVEALPVMVPPRARRKEVPRELFEGLDLILTSVFHEDLARELGDRLPLPLVVLRINPAFTEELDRRLTRGAVTVVMADEEYAVRAERFLGVTSHRGRARFVRQEHFVPDRDAIDREDVLLTRAVRRNLGLEDFHLIPPPPGLISSETAYDLLLAITNLSLARS